MKLTKRIIAALGAAVMLSCTVSCDNGVDESAAEEAAKNIINMSQDEMPYGATITKVLPNTNSDVNIGIEFDNRFVTVDEAVALSHYIEALSNCDGDLLSKTYQKDRLDFILENQEETDASEYLKKVSENLRKNYLEGENFDFNYILVEMCYDESYDDEDTGFSIMDNFLAEHAGKDILDKITSRKLVQYDVQYSVESVPENRYMLSYHTGTSSRMYLYTIDGVVYVM